MKNTENFDLVLFIFIVFVVVLGAFFILFGPCPNCHCLVGIHDFCPVCGYEIEPHCDVCGEICRSEFCTLCGAEQ